MADLGEYPSDGFRRSGLVAAAVRDLLNEDHPSWGVLRLHQHEMHVAGFYVQARTVPDRMDEEVHRPLVTVDPDLEYLGVPVAGATADNETQVLTERWGYGVGKLTPHVSKLTIFDDHHCAKRIATRRRPPIEL